MGHLCLLFSHFMGNMSYVREAMDHKCTVYDSPELRIDTLRVIEHYVLFKTTIKDQIQELRAPALCHKSCMGALGVQLYLL